MPPTYRDYQDAELVHPVDLRPARVEHGRHATSVRTHHADPLPQRIQDHGDTIPPRVLLRHHPRGRPAASNVTPHTTGCLSQKAISQPVIPPRPY